MVDATAAVLETRDEALVDATMAAAIIETRDEALVDATTAEADLAIGDIVKDDKARTPKIVLERGARYSIEGRGILRTLPCVDELQACRILWDEPEAEDESRSAVIFCFSAKRQQVDLKIGVVVRSRYAEPEYVSGFRTDCFGNNAVKRHVKHLLSRPHVFWDGELIVKGDGAEGVTPQCLAEESDIPRLVTLLKAGEDIDQVDKNGESALMAACRAGQIDAAKFLVARGARVNLCGQGETGEQDSRLGMRERAALALAAAQGHTELVDFLLEANADVELRNDGKPPIVWACQGGNPGCIERLLRAGADCNVRVTDVFSSNNTPLIVAATFTNFQAVELVRAASLMADLIDCRTGCCPCAASRLRKPFLRRAHNVLALPAPHCSVPVHKMRSC
eukprot:7383067-Prymnesium_polylepis.1